MGELLGNFEVELWLLNSMTYLSEEALDLNWLTWYGRVAHARRWPPLDIHCSLKYIVWNADQGDHFVSLRRDVEALTNRTSQIR